MFEDKRAKTQYSKTRKYNEVFKKQKRGESSSTRRDLKSLLSLQPMKINVKQATPLKYEDYRTTQNDSKESTLPISKLAIEFNKVESKEEIQAKRFKGITKLNKAIMNRQLPEHQH